MAANKICFINLKGFDLIVKSAKPRYIGGAEMQQTLIAQGLKNYGYIVNFITLDFGQKDGLEFEGNKIYKAYHTEKGIPLIRFIFPRLFGFWFAMQRADADIYHLMGRGYESGLAALWCKLHNRRFIYAIAADADCRSDLIYMPKLYEKLLYRYGLNRAQIVIAQTKSQQHDLKINFNIKSAIISNCTKKPSIDYSITRTYPVNVASIQIAWVGRFVQVKRLEWLLDLAETAPKLSFSVAGWGDENDEYVKKMIERGKRIQNIRLLGRLSSDSMENVYQNTDLLVCTSIREGLPNVFMEAWARGIPIISTVDPEDAIKKFDLGRVVTDVKGISTAIEEISNSKDFWKTLSNSCIRYYKKNHTIESTASEYDALIKNLF